jgi:hypothetical protein
MNYRTSLLAAVLMALSTAAPLGAIAQQTQTQLQNGSHQTMPQQGAPQQGTSQQGKSKKNSGSATSPGTQTLFGVEISPSKGQSVSQQDNDERACYNQAKTNSGVNPETLHQQTASKNSTGQMANTATTTQNSTSQLAQGAAQALGGSMGGMAGGMASALGPSLASAQTHYQQAPAESQQGHPMKKFRREFSSCLQSKGYDTSRTHHQGKKQRTQGNIPP